MSEVKQILNILSSRYGMTPMEEAFGNDQFQFLAAVMLSARSRDSMTIPVAKNIFLLAPTAERILEMPREELEQLLRPIGFYRVKAKYLHGLAKKIVEKFDGKVPESFENLTTLPGVSRKVANVVLSQLYGKDVVAVDVHVNRISGRLGWVTTTKPEETEKELMKVVERKYWRKINQVLVQHGQQICVPRQPRCEKCIVKEHCPRIGLE